jgi:hypothetical protein
MKRKKPTGSLYHLSHGQREPEGFWFALSPRADRGVKKQTADQLSFFSHANLMKTLTASAVGSYGDWANSRTV